MTLIRPDSRFVEIRYELWALEEFLQTLERQIASLRSQDERAILEYLRENGLTDDEAAPQLEWQEFDDRHTNVISRFFRGPFLTSLWALYESATSEIAEHVRAKRETQLSLRDIRASNDLERIKKYFEAVLTIPIEANPDRYAFIEDLRIVRNAIAHANGQRRAMSAQRWAAVTLVLARHGAPVDDYRGLVIPSQAFTAEAFEVVNASLRELLSRVRSA